MPDDRLSTRHRTALPLASPCHGRTPQAAGGDVVAIRFLTMPCTSARSVAPHGRHHPNLGRRPHAGMTAGYARNASGVGAAVIIFEADDVVLTEVLAVLDLHKYDVGICRILDPMIGPDRDVH